MNDLKHVLIIPDGNRTYAKKKSIDTKVVYRWISDFTTTELIRFFAVTKKISELSIFGLSRKNLLRNKQELSEIYSAQEYLAEEWLKNKSFQNAKIKFKIIGDKDLLPKKHLEKIMLLEKKTQKNTGTLVNLLVGYDGQFEILQALKNMPNHKIPDNPKEFYKYLGIKTPVDLIIRTGIEKRFSGAPLFQTAYSEFVFTGYHYPELTIEKLKQIIEDYEKRDRKYGK